MLQRPDSTRPRWWTSPTYAQARHGLTGLVDYARQWGVLDSYTTTTPLTCRLTNGSFVNALSWDNPQGMYGPTVPEGVSDEFGWMTPQAYSAISSRRAATIVEGLGDWLWIGNVGTIGGEAQKLWDLAEGGADGFSAARWSWRDMAEAQPCICGNGKQIPVELDHAGEHKTACRRGTYLLFIRSERQRMSRAQFAQLYEAEWADWNDLPVYSFDRAVHVSAEHASYQPELPVLLSCDFNVDPMVWTLGQSHMGRGWTFDEIVIPGGATTQAACDEFKRRFPSFKTPLEIDGDRSGSSRDTKSKQTDYQIIRRELGHYIGFSVHVPSANPPVSERINAVNAKLEAGDLHIHPRCKHLIEDRARVSYKPGTREIDKSNKQRTHASDADDYRWARMFPIRPPMPVFIAESSSVPFHDPILSEVY